MVSSSSSSCSSSWWPPSIESRRRRLPCHQPPTSELDTWRRRQPHYSYTADDTPSCELSTITGGYGHHRRRRCHGICDVVEVDDDHDDTRGISAHWCRQTLRQQQLNGDNNDGEEGATTTASPIDGNDEPITRRSLLFCFPGATTMFIFLAIILGSATSTVLPSVEAFTSIHQHHHHPDYAALLSHPPFSSSSRLYAEVRKRSGNHHERQQRQQQQQQQQQQYHHHVVVGGGSVGSSVSGGGGVGGSNNNVLQHRSRVNKKSNVFEQFTPEYIASPFDVDFRQASTSTSSTSATTTSSSIATDSVSLRKKRMAATTSGSSSSFNTINNNKSRLVKRSRNGNNGSKTNNKHPISSSSNNNNIIINNNHKVNRRLQSLLTDDTGEQEMEMYPDHSPEAAMQLADLKSYSKLNEEARRKASLAVQSNDDDDGDEEEEEVEEGSGNDGYYYDDTAVVEKKTSERKQLTPLPSMSASITAGGVGGSMIENERGRKKRSQIQEGGSGGGGGEESMTTSATVAGVGKRAVQIEEGHLNTRVVPPSSPSTTNSISHRSNKMVITAVGGPSSPSLSSSSSMDQLQSQAPRGRTAASASLTTTPTTPTIMSRSRGRTSTTSTRVRATVKETGSDSISTYIKSLVQHELLYKEDEILLGRQVRMLSKLEEKRSELEMQLLRPPTFAQWAEATNHTVPSLKQQIRKSQRAKAALIEANLRLVITVARQAVKKSPFLHSNNSQSSGASSVQFQDACQQGIIGLTRATEKFDPELGFRFSTYAIWWIQKEVAKNVSEQSRSVRVPPSAIKKINDIRIQERILMNELGRKPHDEELAGRVGMTVEKLNFYRQSAKEVSSLDKKIDARTGKGSMSTGGDGAAGNTMDIFVKDTEHPSPTELIDEQMLKEDIRRLVRTLSPREQAVIRLRFGLDDGKPLGLSDISAKFGVEKERIKKIEARALLKLRQPSRSQVVKCYVSDHT
ncbi:hypothetical protein ACHAXH_001557 [Discostella pseudostelligera]